MSGSLVTNYLAQGAAASRPATPTAATGTLSLYFATDTETLSLYDWNDGAWQDLSTSGTTFCSTTEQLTGTETAKASSPDTVAALWEKGSDIASAGTISIGEGGFFHITGTTTITDIDFATDKSGRKAILVFDGALTLTHNATSLILPTGANITTAAGDCCLVVSEDGSNNVRVVWYQRANGTALTATQGLTLIQSITTSSSATTITFSAIAGTYKDLILSATLRSQQAATSSTLEMLFNGDTGSNYNSERMNASGTSVNAAQSLAAAAFTIGGVIPGSSASADYAGQVEIRIVNYAGTTFNKTYIAEAARSTADSSGNTLYGTSGGMWKSTSAITSVTLQINGGSAFVDGSVARLYGRG